MKVAVVGGLNVDISANAGSELRMRDSNPGTVQISMGGVGRNIAENLRRLQCDTALVTMMGDDPLGQLALDACEAAGLDMRWSQRVSGCGTGTYVCVSDETGDLVTAVSDMAICSLMTPEWLSSRLEMLNSQDAVVLDANLSEAAIDYLVRHVQVPLAADPVSAAKAPRLLQALPHLAMLKPNRQEAERLICLSEDGPAVQSLVERGVRSVFLSLGAEGVRYHDTCHTGNVSCLPARIVNTSGCGDAFLAGALWAMLHGFDIREQAVAGQAAAAICAESPLAVSPLMSAEALLQRCQPFHFKGGNDLGS